MSLYIDNNNLVVRNGTKQTIPSKNILVGDIVFLSKGVTAPADGILIEGDLIVGLLFLSPYQESKQNIDRSGDPFVRGGHRVVEGNKKMLVLAVGKYSFAGFV